MNEDELRKVAIALAAENYFLMTGEDPEKVSDNFCNRLRGDLEKNMFFDYDPKKGALGFFMSYGSVYVYDMTSKQGIDAFFSTPLPGKLVKLPGLLQQVVKVVKLWRYNANDNKNSLGALITIPVKKKV